MNALRTAAACLCAALSACAAPFDPEIHPAGPSPMSIRFAHPVAPPMFHNLLLPLPSPLAPRTEPVLAGATYGAASAVFAEPLDCPGPFALERGNLRLSIARALEQCGAPLLHWFPGDAENIYDFHLERRVEFGDPPLDRLSDWLTTHYGLELSRDPENGAVDVRSIAP